MKRLLIILSVIMILIVTPVFAADLNVQVNSSEGSINFRNYPSRSSQVIYEIPDGTMLHVTDLNYNRTDDLIFGRTSYAGLDGWISLRQTNIADFNGFNTTVNSDQGSINFRASASTGSSVISEIPNGTSLYISDMFYNAGDDLFFGQTTYNGVTGWISLRQTSLGSASYIPVQSAPSAQTPASSGENPTGLSIRTDVGFNGVVQVTSESGSINFRPIPSTSSAVLCEIPNHTALNIYDIVRNEDLIWGYTQYNGTWGWVSLRQTATPMHEYGMPDYVRDWDGVSSDMAAANDIGVVAGQEDAVYRYYNNDENREVVQNETGAHEYVYPEAHIRFTSYDVGQPGDYSTINDWPHYAVIEHYDENGTTLWSITTDNVYCLNGGYSPIGASSDTFFYTKYDDIYAIDIEDGSLIWTVPNQIGGHDGGFRGKAVGKAGEVYICVTSSGRCMVINTAGEVIHVDDGFFGPNLVFTDIRYSGDNMISVTARSEDGKVNQFLISRDAL